MRVNGVMPVLKEMVTGSFTKAKQIHGQAKADPYKVLKLNNFWTNPEASSLKNNKEYGIVYHGAGGVERANSMMEQIRANMEKFGMATLDSSASEASLQNSDSNASLYVTGNIIDALHWKGWDQHVVTVAVKGGIDSIETDPNYNTNFIPKGVEAVILSIDTAENPEETCRESFRRPPSLVTIFARTLMKEVMDFMSSATSKDTLIIGDEGLKMEKE